MKKITLLFALLLAMSSLNAQQLTLPPSGFNLKSGISQRIGTTDVAISWDAPGVKGREGKIWGTTIVHYGFQNLGFGTAKESPWRAGANENTTMSFSTDVSIEGKPLKAGKYGFFIAVYPDSCVLIFSKNSSAWGSYFYDPGEDALRVSCKQEKNLPASREWLAYTFSGQTEHSAVVALEWEHWRIPFTVSVDVPKVTVEAMRRDLQGATGFVRQNWQAAAQFCLDNNYNLEEALVWAENSVSPPFGSPNMPGYTVKAQILEKMNKPEEAEKVMQKALESGSISELHQYGRQLLNQKKPQKALEVFQLNYKKHGDAWPVHVGLARGYSATGDLKKALEHAKTARAQATDDINKTSLDGMIKTLESGKAIAQ